MKLKGLIVDDETKSRALLKILCEDFCENLEIVAQAASVNEAIEKIDVFHPDLVFLDIQMPSKSGFALLDHYEDQLDFEVIFTTAYDQYAIKAFQYTAIDYLLKPIIVDDLISSVKKVAAREKRQASGFHIAELRKQLMNHHFEKIALTTVDGFTFVKLSEIIRCEAEGNYTMVYLENSNPLLITKTLKHYEEILGDKHFFRTHKSHLINLTYVRKFVRGKQSMIEMVDGKMIEVSLRKKDALLKRLTIGKRLNV